MSNQLRPFANSPNHLTVLWIARHPDSSSPLQDCNERGVIFGGSIYRNNVAAGISPVQAAKPLQLRTNTRIDPVTPITIRYAVDAPES